jgi:DNA-binding IclR family transcriptional regulator
MVKSAYRVIQILEAVASSRAGLKHGDLAEALKIPKGSLSLLLSDLISQDYLALKDDSRCYVLGPQVLVIANRYLSGLDLVQLGRPILKEMVATTGECVEIAVRRGEEMLVVAREDCSRPLRSVIPIGDRAPLHATAAGKAILAFFPTEELDLYLADGKLKRMTRRTITQPKVLRKELEDICAGSMAFSREELNEGITAMALPVFDSEGRVNASMVIPVPTIRFNAKKEKRVEAALRKGTTELSRKLGFRGSPNGNRFPLERQATPHSSRRHAGLGPASRAHPDSGLHRNVETEGLNRRRNHGRSGRNSF